MIDDAVIVTGGAGFIGSHLVDRLLESGFQVTVVDDFSVGSEENLKGAMKFGSQLQIVRQDLTEPELLDIMEKTSPRYIFHLAAQSDVRHSTADPLFDAKVNVLGSLNVIESARRVGVERVIYAASGGTLYGEPEAVMLPLTEAIRHQPLSNYGVSKKVVLDYLAAYKSLYSLGYVALALANVFGPRQDPYGESGVVSIFAGQLVSNQRCIIFGDGNQTRDFVFVADVVDAFLRSMDSGEGEVFNISSSKETSVSELYCTMAKILGSSLEPEFLEGRVGELRRSCLSNSKACEILEWEPKVSLADGLGQVIAWVKGQS